jgi:hypothetical protein
MEYRGGAHVPGGSRRRRDLGDIFGFLARTLKAGEREFGPVMGTASDCGSEILHVIIHLNYFYYWLCFIICLIKNIDLNI